MRHDSGDGKSSQKLRFIEVKHRQRFDWNISTVTSTSWPSSDPIPFSKMLTISGVDTPFGLPLNSDIQYFVIANEATGSWKQNLARFNIGLHKSFCCIVYKGGLHISHSFVITKISTPMTSLSIFKILIISNSSQSFSRQPSKTTTVFVCLARLIFIVANASCFQRKHDCVYMLLMEIFLWSIK